MMENGSEKRRTRRSGLGTGTTSLLMIFTLLCLATLALLSLTTARSDQRIKQRGAEANISLLAAEGVAAEALGELDAVLADVQSGQPADVDEASYYEAAHTALSAAGFGVNEEYRMAAFIVQVDENTQLYTVVLLLPPGASARYELVSQTTETTLDWTPEMDAGVWQPNT